MRFMKKAFLKISVLVVSMISVAAFSSVSAYAGKFTANVEMSGFGNPPLITRINNGLVSGSNLNCEKGLDLNTFRCFAEIDFVSLFNEVNLSIVGDYFTQNISVKSIQLRSDGDCELLRHPLTNIKTDKKRAHIYEKIDIGHCF